MCCRIGLPVIRVGIVEAKVVGYLYPVALQKASGCDEGALQRRSATSSHPVALDWKLTLCF